MYVQPVPLIWNTPPWASASGSTATAAIGQIVAMNVVTSMPLAEVLVEATYATRSSIAITPNTFPSSEASPFGGALNSTSATPPNASAAKPARADRCTRRTARRRRGR